MAAKRADQANRDRMADEAHRHWEAEKSHHSRTAWQREVQRQQTLAQQRQKHEQHKVRCFAIVVHC